MASIEVDDTMARILKRAVDKAYPGIADEISAIVDRVHRDAVVMWPVKTGRSVRSLDHYVSIGQLEIRGVVESVGVDYAFYIRPKSLYNGNTAWSEWVQRPLQAARQEFVETFGAQLVADLAGGSGG